VKDRNEGRGRGMIMMHKQKRVEGNKGGKETEVYKLM
jgi:hypothetical protein